MKKGFTLVELLAVLVVLGLIGLLVYPAIEKTIKGVRGDLYENQKDAIIDGIKNWAADNPRWLPNNNETIYVSLGQLKIGKYVDINLIDPRTDKLFDNATKIIIQRKNNKYVYDVLLDETNLVETDTKTVINYPNVEFVGDLVVHLDKNEEYIEKGLIVNGNFYAANSPEDDVSVANYGSIITDGYVKYSIKNESNGINNLTLYRTVIVNS